jgi:hypothetical protein
LPLLPPLFPLSSRLCLQQTEALVTGEEPGRPGSTSPSRLPGSPRPPPLASESRASGRPQPCQGTLWPAQLTGPVQEGPSAPESSAPGIPPPPHTHTHTLGGKWAQTLASDRIFPTSVPALIATPLKLRCGFVVIAPTHPISHKTSSSPRPS